MPRSIFLGRKPGADEPLWLDDDTEAALEYMDYLDSLCSGCGNPRHESFHKDNFSAYEATALRCHACATRDIETTSRSKSENTVNDGIYISVTKKEGG